jgi:hypothetical protein
MISIFNKAKAFRRVKEHFTKLTSLWLLDFITASTEREV